MRLPISLLGCSVMPGMPQRRFPPPWSVEEMNDACFIVRDQNGHALAYRLFRKRARATGSCQPAHQRRGAADRGQYREVAKVVATFRSKTIEPARHWTDNEPGTKRGYLRKWRVDRGRAADS